MLDGTKFPSTYSKGLPNALVELTEASDVELVHKWPKILAGIESSGHSRPL
jgi:hypothetical protein